MEAQVTPKEYPVQLATDSGLYNLSNNSFVIGAESKLCKQPQGKLSPSFNKFE